MFDAAPVFNGDLRQWDVASVTSLRESKSISIPEKVSGLCVRCLDFMKCPDFVLGVRMLF